MNKFWKYDILKAFKSKDEIELFKTLDEMSDKMDEEAKKEEIETKDEVSLEDRIAKLEAIIEKLVKTDEEAHTEDEVEEEDKKDVLVEDEENLLEEEEKEKTTDSLKEIFSDAVILHPQIKFKSQTTDSIDSDLATKYKHQTLKRAYTTDSGKKVIDHFLGDLDVNILDEVQVGTIFGKAVELAKQNNNSKFNHKTVDSAVNKLDFKDMDQKNKDFWSKTKTTI